MEATGFQNGNNSAHLGECPRDDKCKRKFYFYLAVQTMYHFFTALGGASTFMLIFKWVWFFKAILCVLDYKHT